MRGGGLACFPARQVLPVIGWGFRPLCRPVSHGVTACVSVVIGRKLFISFKYVGVSARNPLCGWVRACRDVGSEPQSLVYAEILEYNLLMAPHLDTTGQNGAGRTNIPRMSPKRPFFIRPR